MAYRTCQRRQRRKIFAARGSAPGPRAFRTPRAPGESGSATLLASRPGVLQAPNTPQRVQGYKCQELRNQPQQAEAEVVAAVAGRPVAAICRPAAAGVVVPAPASVHP